jgi:fumarate reductase subunit D
VAFTLMPVLDLLPDNPNNDAHVFAFIVSLFSIKLLIKLILYPLWLNLHQ